MPDVSSLKVLAGAVAICLFVAIPVIAQNTEIPPVQIPESVIVSTNDPFEFPGWDNGTLAFEIKNPQNESKNIKVEFRGERNRHLTSLKVSTTDWSADVTQYVRQLSTPFPGRIGILFDWDRNGRIKSLDLELPYLDQPIETPRSENKCMVAELLIDAGRVFQSSSRIDNTSRCKQ